MRWPKSSFWSRKHMQGTGWVLGCRCAGGAGAWDGRSSGVLWGLAAGNRTSSCLAPDPATPQSQQACCGLDLGVGTIARLLQAFWVTAYWPCCFIFQFKTYFALVYPDPRPAYSFGVKSRVSSQVSGTGRSVGSAS